MCRKDRTSGDGFGFFPLAMLGMMTIFVAGCGKTGPTVAGVSGIVTYKGKPLPNVMVLFFPKDVTGGVVGRAQTDQEGRFHSASTYDSGDGVVVGKHAVTFTEALPPDLKEIPRDSTGMELSPPRGPWPAKFRDSANAAILVDVTEKGNNHFEFDLSK